MITPRPPVANPSLTRPDWTSLAVRDSTLLWLDKNENGDPLLIDLVARVVCEVAPRNVAIYPDSGPVYAKLAAMVGVEPRQLVFAAGSDGVIRSVFEAFVDTGDRVIHTAPTFAMYPVYSKIYGASVTTVSYEASALGPVLPFEKLLDSIRELEPRLVCLPNPDSPTGTVLTSAQIEELAVATASTNSVLLIDEAYYPFHEFTAVPLIERYPNLIVARTFAKAWGMAGLRVGYAVASPQVAEWLHKVRPMYEVNTVAIATVGRMLDFQDDVAASVRRLIDGRDTFSGFLSASGFRTLRTHGNFLHVEFGKHAEAIHRQLAPIALYRQNASEACLAGFSRFSATTTERLQPVMDAIRKAALNP